TPLLFRLLGLGNRRHCPPPAITAVVCRLPVAEGTKPCVQVRVPPSPLPLCLASGVVRRRNRELRCKIACAEEVWVSGEGNGASQC
uniref:Uncharacterized protein n=1 Tax=Aegilops tauschii subsp. strangulata TaxID=200361 RepID=A0A453HT29_AEGTS